MIRQPPGWHDRHEPQMTDARAVHQPVIRPALRWRGGIPKTHTPTKESVHAQANHHGGRHARGPGRVRARRIGHRLRQDPPRQRQPPRHRAESPGTTADAPGGANVQSGDQTAPDTGTATAASASVRRPAPKPTVPAVRTCSPAAKPAVPTPARPRPRGPRPRRHPRRPAQLTALAVPTCRPAATPSSKHTPSRGPSRSGTRPNARSRHAGLVSAD